MSESTVRILAFSDYRVQDLSQLVDFIHSKRPPYDIIVYAGDDVRRFDEGDRNYFEEIGKHSKHGLLAVIGNDDTKDCKGVLRGKNVHDLHEEPYVLDRYAFLGQEASTGDIGLTLYSEDEVQNHLENQIQKVGRDKSLVLVSHSPPFGVLDFAQRFGSKHIGSRSIREFIEEYGFMLNICGHVHMYGGNTERLKETLVLNIASHDEPGSLGKLAEVYIFRGRLTVKFQTVEEEEIRKLRDIGPVRSERLIDEGYTSVSRIASVAPEVVAERTGIYPKIAWKACLSAKALNNGEIYQIRDFQPPDKPTYLDVETTPRERFMTGVYDPEEDEFNQFTVRNWNDADEKRSIGRAIFEYFKEKEGSIVTYTKYDLRFISEKILRSRSHYDLYDWLKRSFILPTTDYKLQSVGEVFGYRWKAPELTGWDMPRLYRDFLKSNNEEYLDQIKQHNKDDVMAMYFIVEQIKNREFNQQDYDRNKFKHLYK